MADGQRLLPLTSDNLCEQKWLRSVLTGMTHSTRLMVSVGSSQSHKGGSSLTPWGQRQAPESRELTGVPGA